MAKAKRHYIPGQIWHLTHRCHKREFLLKFSKDRHRWLQWLYEARKRHDLTILNYTVTSNHIHLLVMDDGKRDVIPKSIQLVAGRTGQEYNQRKKRKGAFWEDRYHATAIENGKHLIRCLIYIDLNMVRTEAIAHPSQWPFSGYNEIQNPKRKNVLIHYEKLRKLLSIDSYDLLKEYHRGWVGKSLDNGGNSRDEKWTKSIAVGSKGFIEEVRLVLGAMAKGRKGLKAAEGYQLRDPSSPYKAHFDIKNEGIGANNTYYWDINDEYSIRQRGPTPSHPTFCPGCPHRASYWIINSALKQDNRDGFVCGDIGCYTMGAISCGFNVLKTSHAMGSGTGLASGFGKFNRFEFDQPVMAISGDSTFFHAVMPALVNAVHNQADIILVVVDNSGTAMTGFQPHPGTVSDAGGGALPALDIARICQAMDIDVAIADPFEMESTEKTLLELLDNGGGVRVLILRQACALSPEKKGKRLFDMAVDEAACLAEDCGCNRLCTRIFGCPGLIWDPEIKKTRIDEVICVGCGVCASICPTGAISKKEVA